MSEVLPVSRESVVSTYPVAPADRFVPQGLSTKSTLGKAAPQTKEREPTRPKLPPPNWVFISIDIQKSFETTLDRLVHFFDTTSKREMAKSVKYSEEEFETLEQSALEVANIDTWGVYSKAAEYLCCAGSIALGVYLFPVAFPVALMFMVAGGAGLVKRVAEDTVGLETLASFLTNSAEEQKRIATEIDWGFTAIEVGTALAAAGMEAAGVTLGTAKNAVTAFEYGTAAAGGVTQLGTAYAEWNHSTTQETLKRLNAFIETCRIKVSDQASEARKWGETSIEMERMIDGVISAVEVHN